MKLLFTSAAASALLLFSVAPAFASDADAIVDLTLNSNAPETAKAAFVPLLDRLRQQGVPPEGIKEVSDAAGDFFKQTYQDPDFRKEVVKVYEKTYTPEELHTLLEFYKTPLGQKMIAAMPQIAQQIMTASQKYGMKNQEAFQEKIRAVMQRYQGGGESAPLPAPKPEGK